MRLCVCLLFGMTMVWFNEINCGKRIPLTIEHRDSTGLMRCWPQGALVKSENRSFNYKVKLSEEMVIIF